MANPWDPPEDLSGGFFHLTVSNGTNTHKMRLHVDAFDASTFNYIAGHGSETSVDQTIGNFRDLMTNWWTSAWEITPLDLWQMQSGVPVPIIPPSVSGAAGVNTGAESTSPAGMNVWVARTTGGHHFKLNQIAPATWDPAPPIIATSGTSGAIGTLITYLVGPNTGIVAHDGTQPVDYFRVSYPINDRLFRAYHLN